MEQLTLHMNSHRVPQVHNCNFDTYSPIQYLAPLACTKCCGERRCQPRAPCPAHSCCPGAPGLSVFPTAACRDGNLGLTVSPQHFSRCSAAEPTGVCPAPPPPPPSGNAAAPLLGTGTVHGDQLSGTSSSAPLLLQYFWLSNHVFISTEMKRHLLL